jgi:hypothetical protein
MALNLGGMFDDPDDPIDGTSGGGHLYTYKGII